MIGASLGHVSHSACASFEGRNEEKEEEKEEEEDEEEEEELATLGARLAERVTAPLLAGGSVEAAAETGVLAAAGVRTSVGGAGEAGIARETEGCRARPRPRPAKPPVQPTLAGGAETGEAAEETEEEAADSWSQTQGRMCVWECRAITPYLREALWMPPRVPQTAMRASQAWPERSPAREGVPERLDPRAGWRGPPVGRSWPAGWRAAARPRQLGLCPARPQLRCDIWPPVLNVLLHSMAAPALLCPRSTRRCTFLHDLYDRHHRIPR